MKTTFGLTFKFTRLLAFALAMTATMSISSCSDDPDTNTGGGTLPPPVDPVDPPNYVYLKFNPQTASNLTVNALDGEEHGYYLESTGRDPNVQTAPFDRDLGDSLVLTFEYITTEDIDNVQIYFGPPVTENRSTRGMTLPATTTWRTTSISLARHAWDLPWGSKDDFMRFDPGDFDGVGLFIRNMRMRGLTDAEAEEADNRPADEKLDAGLEAYFAAQYSSKITNVTVGHAAVTITGTCPTDGEFYALVEIPPYLNVTSQAELNSMTAVAIDNGSFTMNMPRMVNRGGYMYDRALSKWAVLKEGTTADVLDSHARYADTFTDAEATQKLTPSSIKGIGLYDNVSLFESDVQAMGIRGTTINLLLTEYMYASNPGNAYVHTYGNKTYYFNKASIDNLDAFVKYCDGAGVVMNGIILIGPAASANDPEIGAKLQHPDYSSGHYTMPNMTDMDGVMTYAAGVDFLISRYTKEAATYGRIQKWIIHNEVDMGYEWTNMGATKRPLNVFMDAYMKSMRLCYNIGRSYDANFEVYPSFAHSWTRAQNNSSYATKDMLDVINKYTRVEGDFEWGLAYHCYPESLLEPLFWSADVNTTFSMSTPLVTYNNLEVLDKWAEMTENKYNGTKIRSIWLSENGLNSRSYSDAHLQEQARAVVYLWKKISQLKHLEMHIWHNWRDHPTEMKDGLRIGLRKSPDDNSEPKPAWDIYRKGGTSEESDFDAYLSGFGLTNWSQIIHTVN